MLPGLLGYAQGRVRCGAGCAAARLGMLRRHRYHQTHHPPRKESEMSRAIRSEHHRSTRQVPMTNGEISLVRRALSYYIQAQRMASTAAAQRPGEEWVVTECSVAVKAAGALRDRLLLDP